MPAVDQGIGFGSKVQVRYSYWTSIGDMSWDYRSALVNHLRLAEMRLSEAIKKAQKAFDEKVIDHEQFVKDITMQRESASKRR